MFKHVSLLFLAIVSISTHIATHTEGIGGGFNTSAQDPNGPWIRPTSGGNAS